MPNLVVVHTDDTGRYIGPYGHAIDTPHLQAIANRGTLFRRAYCAGPTCSPSRGAMMTGQAPHSNGLIGLAHRGFSIDDYDHHLAGYLSERGHESVLVGQQHEVGGVDVRESLGYDRVLETDPDEVRELPVDHEKSQRDLARAEAAAEYVREDHDDPFFLSVGLVNTHKEFPLDQEEVDPDYVQPPAPLPDVPAVREEMAAYHVAAKYVDECVGAVHEALRETGQLSETVFVFTTDHGLPFPSMKCTLFEGGTGISLAIRFPDSVDAPAGVAEDALVSNVDLFPTFCEVLDVAVPEWTEGSSLLPLVRGEVDRVREAVFSEVSYHAAYEPKRCIRTNRYTYIRRYDDNEGNTEWAPEGRVPCIPANIDRGNAKDFLIEDMLERGLPREALYDRKLDPNERENLAGEPAYSEIREQLAGRLERWMRRTDDPILDGPISKPAGAKADPRDALHPDDGEFEPEAAR